MPAGSLRGHSRRGQAPHGHRRERRRRAHHGSGIRRGMRDAGLPAGLPARDWISSSSSSPIPPCSIATDVLEGIGHLLSRKGEVWAKLDAGTEEWYQKVNISRVSLDRVEANLVRLGRSHPFKIQSLFCGLDGVTPSAQGAGRLSGASHAHPGFRQRHPGSATPYPGAQTGPGLAAPP